MSKCRSIVICRASAAGRTTSMAASATLARDIVWMSRRSLPLITRAMSSRSSTSRSCDAAFRSMTSSACVRERRFGCVRRMRVQPRTALSGVRISWESVARNSSFRREASSATWRARSDTEIWLRSSRSLITRSVTSSITVIVPMTRVAREQRGDPGALRHLGQPGGVKAPRDRQQVLVEALRQQSDLPAERLPVIPVETALHETGNHLGYRLADDGVFRPGRSAPRASRSTNAPRAIRRW